MKIEKTFAGIPDGKGAIEENEDGIFFSLGSKRIRPLEKTLLKKDDEVAVFEAHPGGHGMLFHVYMTQRDHSETWGIRYPQRTLFEKNLERGIGG
jgi:hypothetical protein